MSVSILIATNVSFLYSNSKSLNWNADEIHLQTFERVFLFWRKEVKPMKEKEIRKLDMQFRTETTDDGKMKIKGYAVVFGSPETYEYTDVLFPLLEDNYKIRLENKTPIPTF